MVVFVAIIPVMNDSDTAVIILSRTCSDSSGEIFINIGIFNLISIDFSSRAEIKIFRFSLLCNSLKFGVLGEDILIVI